ncbi:MAG: alpha/beta hydrolase-fold protein, partial [Flavobacteriaceae bacterium]|nr:alpha/beta hydrolase-fold protein [Flavobacteriaceae bacterium]
FGWTTLHGQVIYEKFKSDKLGETRELKIQLPRSYSKENSIKYPLVIVLDGDYLFEPVIGNIDYQSYWNDMPECIIVGINQEGSRDFDLYFSEITGLPEAEGASFFEFIGMELIPYMEGKYKASNFRIAIGHDKSANFINYYLFKDHPIFKAYMVFSPDLAPEMVNRLSQRLASLEPVTFYYLATSEGDISNLKEDIVAANNVLKSIDNPNLYYTFDNFDDASHYSLVGQGIPRALNSIFELFKPIDAIEYKEEMLTYAGSPMEYLVKKYEDIEAFYGFKKRYVENDLRAVAAAAKKKDDIEAFKELSKLAKQEFPESMISAYYQGLYFELDGNLKRALNYYQSGLLLEPSQFITKDVLLDKIYEMKDERD